MLEENNIKPVTQSKKTPWSTETNTVKIWNPDNGKTIRIKKKKVILIKKNLIKKRKPWSKKQTLIKKKETLTK